MMLREILPTGAHIAPHGTKAEYFDTAADALKANTEFSTPIEGQSVRDRYERLQKAFDKKDKANTVMSGVGGGVTEAEQSFSEMREAREEHVAQRIERRKAIQDRDQRKLDVGARLVAILVEKATCRGPIVISNEENGDLSEAEGGIGENQDKIGRAKKKKCRIVNHGQVYQGEMERFGNLLKQNDEAQLVLEEKKLNLKEWRFEAAEKRRAEDRADRRREREEERKERMEDREARDCLELEKFKLMIEMLKKDHNTK